MKFLGEFSFIKKKSDQDSKLYSDENGDSMISQKIDELNYDEYDDDDDELGNVDPKLQALQVNQEKILKMVVRIKNLKFRIKFVKIV